MGEAFIFAANATVAATTNLARKIGDVSGTENERLPLPMRVANAVNAVSNLGVRFCIFDDCRYHIRLR